MGISHAAGQQMPCTSYLSTTRGHSRAEPETACAWVWLPNPENHLELKSQGWCLSAEPGENLKPRGQWPQNRTPKLTRK